MRAFGDVEPGEVLCYLDSGDWVAIAAMRHEPPQGNTGLNVMK